MRSGDNHVLLASAAVAHLLEMNRYSYLPQRSSNNLGSAQLKIKYFWLLQLLHTYLR